MYDDSTSADDSALTHDDLARETGVSVTTIKSYRRKFPGFIPVLGFGKPIRFAPKALQVCFLVRDCFAEGLSVRDTRKRLEEAGFTQDPGSVPPPSEAGAVNDERMDEFLRAAGIMMQSVSKLAEAQKRTDHRLEQLEELMKQLAQAEAENRLTLARLGAAPPTPGRFGSDAPGPTNVPPRRVVKVRSSQGTIKAYTLGGEDGQGAVPPDELLDVPVALRKEGGEYLGLPGKLTLRSLTDKLPGQGDPLGKTGPAWKQEGAAWRFELANPGGKPCGLCFEAQTTPAGVNLAVMTRLYLDGQKATPSQRLEYFRQLKNRYAAG